MRARGTRCAGLRTASSPSSASENVAPKIEAIRSRFKASSGRRLRRRSSVRRRWVVATRAGLGPPVQHADRPLIVQGPYELDHEQRIPPGTAHLLEQPRAGRDTDHLAGELSRLT